MFNNQVQHPSFGQIKIGKYTANNSTFYGSDVTHHGGISISISRSIMERDLSKNWYFRGEPLVEVRLSANQFAELITMGMNTEGVPCTLISVQGERQDAYVRENVEEQYSKDVELRINRASERVSDAKRLIEEALSGKTIKKADLERVKHQLTMGLQDMDSNLPFVKKQFDEYMDNAFTELKMDAEHYIDTGLRRLGIEALKGAMIGIENKGDTDNE